MKKIFSKHVLMALLCLVGLFMASCSQNNPSSSSPLANTKWAGKAMLTNVEVSFTTDECYIQVSDYANGTAVGTYKTSNSDVFVTITRTSGDFDGQLNQGDIVIGSFDLNAKTMTINLTLYGEKYPVQLTQK